MAPTCEKTGPGDDDQLAPHYINNIPAADGASIEAAKVIDFRGADEAGAFAGAEGIPIDDATSKKLCRKIDLHMLPIMGGLYMMQYLDKVLLSYTAVMSIKQDININNDQYAWAGSIFYFGYLTLEYPHNLMMQKFPVGKYMSVCVVAWGVVLCCTAAVQNFAGIMVTRFFLGAGEGAITAGFVLITSAWYRAEEQALRTAIWFTCNGVAQIVGGIIAYGVSQGLLDHPIAIASWKFLYILVGGLTSLYGIMMWFVLADSPITAGWLSEDEKRASVERLRGNQQGIGSKVFKWYQVREVFGDIRETYILLAATIAQNIPNGGVTTFFTLMISSYGFTPQQPFLLSIPGGVVQLFVGVGIPYLGGKYKQRMGAAVLGQLISLFGISLMTGLAIKSPLNAVPGQLLGYYIVIATGSVALIMVLSIVSSNTAGHTKKTTVNAIVLIGYCSGFLIGPQTFRDAPYYYNAKYNIIAMWTFSLLCYASMYIINRRENNRRDRQWEADGRPTQPAGQEFLDLTDKENPYFRYAL